MNTPKRNTLLKGDIIIIVAVLILAIITFFLSIQMNNNNNYNSYNNYVSINIDGDNVKNLSLDENTEFIVNNIYENTVVINNGQVKVINATCPDRICENFGSIIGNGQTIICMPNKLVLQIVSDNDTTLNDNYFEIDVIT